MPLRTLAEDPRVDLISFTGSTVVGRISCRCRTDSEEGVPRAGGKSAWIVCDDGHLDANAMMVELPGAPQAGPKAARSNTRYSFSGRSTTR